MTSVQTSPFWFNEHHRLPGATHSLYCFPFAAGSATYYSPWAEHFTATIELVPVQLPGRGPRLTEELATRLDEIADTVTPLIEAASTRPLLFGHSMGAILAFEVARRLQVRGVGADHLFVSGRPAPPIARPTSVVSALPRPRLIQVLRDYGAAEDEVLEHEELLDLLEPMIRADFALIEGYGYQPGPLLSCPITAWHGDSDPEVGTEVVGRWGEQTSSRFTLFTRPGGHFFLTSYRRGMAGTIHRAVAGLTTGSGDAPS